FDKDQFLSEHTAPFDAIVIVIDGHGKITINKKDYTLEENEMIIMPANIPHAVYGIDKFKMLLIMLKD
ncbi:MAG TPA: cupin domain-containing protein, partial [Bacteroidales bacterium]|nr:cupin domain-containing protein [Bacteroidales bacterium]